MNSSSFDRNELQKINQMLTSIVERVAALEQRADATAVNQPAPMDAVALDAEIVEATAVDSIDKDPALSADIVFSNLHQNTPEVQFGETEDYSEKESAIPLAGNPLSPLQSNANTPGQSIESLIGERLFTWIGGVLLVLATAFFVVWSWRNLDFPDWSRCAMMHAVGLGTILAGSWFKSRSLETHSRALYGVGIFGLYASALAMTHLYRLGGEWHQLYGFIDGVLITAAAVFLSLRNKSVGIILLGAFGGYLTPLLTIHGQGDPLIMFGYLAMLNVSLLISGYFGRWNFLTPLAWIATTVTFVVSGWTITSAELGTSLISVHAFIFLAAVSIPHLKWRTCSTSSGNTILVFNSIAFLAGYIALNTPIGDHVAIVCFVLTCIHAILTWYSFQNLGSADRLGRVSLALTMLFLTLGLTIQFRETPQIWTTIWALEGLAFGLIGFMFRDRQMQIAAAIAFLLTIGRAILTDLNPAASFAPEAALLDPRFLRWSFYSVLLAIVGTSHWWIPKIGDEKITPTDLLGRSRSTTPPKVVALCFLVSSNLVLLAAVAFQFHDEPRWILLAAAINCAALWFFGFKSRREFVCNYSTVLAIGVMVGAGLLLVGEINRFLNEPGDWDHVSRISFVSTSLICIAAGFAYWKSIDRFVQPAHEATAHQALTSFGHAGLLAVVTVEILAFFATTSLISDTTMGKMVTWSIIWGVYAAALVVIGFSVRYPLYRYLGIMLFSAVLLKVFIVDLSQFELIVRVGALLFLGLLLLGVSLLYQKFRLRIGADGS